MSDAILHTFPPSAPLFYSDKAAAEKIYFSANGRFTLYDRN